MLQIIFHAGRLLPLSLREECQWQLQIKSVGPLGIRLVMFCILIQNMDLQVCTHCIHTSSKGTIYTLAYVMHTVGRINFEDKKFRGFRGYLLNLEIKYPCNFLYTCSRYFVQHVHMVGK